MQTNELGMVNKLERPDYIVRRRSDRFVVAVLCKVCGTRISYFDPQKGIVRERNYAELKMQFADGSSHVTNCCTGCITRVRKDKAALVAMHRADWDDLALDGPVSDRNVNRLHPRVVKVSTTREGIV